MTQDARFVDGVTGEPLAHVPVGNQETDGVKVPVVVDDSSRSATYGQLVDVDATTAVALADGFEGGIPAGTRYVLVIPTAAARYRGDGSVPTATVGMPIAARQAFPIDGDLDQVKLILQAGVGGVIDMEAKL